MKQHKWAKEIKAWADGAEIEYHFETGAGSMSGWAIDHNPDWNDEECSFRIKPQLKEPQYLYIFKQIGDRLNVSEKLHQFEYQGQYMGKIKLEVDDD